METGRKKVRLGELLVNSGVITAEQLQQALDNPNRQGKKLGEFLVDEGIVSEDDLAKALSPPAGSGYDRSPERQCGQGSTESGTGQRPEEEQDLPLRLQRE